MARRYTSGFDILGFASDPTPGDPDTILNQIVPNYTTIGDDAESAVNALRGNAMQSGTGNTMTKLRKLIGSKYPPKLQQTADSFHGAASVYQTYARSLADAQNQLDRAMDQAAPVAGTANSTVPAAPANATPDQLSAISTQQQNVDQANAQLTAAKRLAQDAKDLRDQAGNSFNKNLRAVSTVPPRSAFQKFLDFFEHSPLIQILIDVAVALVAVFFPVVGFALGLAAFGVTAALNTIATGHFDVGAFASGLAGAAFFGGFGAVAKLAPGLAGAVNSLAGKSGLVAGLLTKTPGTAAKGIAATALKVGKDFGTGFATNFGISAVSGVASTGIKDALNHQKFTGAQAAEVFGGAAVAGGLGGVSKGAEGQIFKDPPAADSAPTDAGGPAGESPTDTGEPAGAPEPPAVTVSPPDSAPSGAAVPASGDGGGLAPPSADTRPDAEADPAAVGTPDNPAVTVSPPDSAPSGAAVPASGDGGGLAPPSADTRPDSEADPAAVGTPDIPAVTVSAPDSAPPGGGSPVSGDGGGLGAPPADIRPDSEADPAAAGTGGNNGSEPAPVTENQPQPATAAPAGDTLGRRAFDQGSGLVQGIGKAAAGVGIAEGVHDNANDDNGNVGEAIGADVSQSEPGTAAATLSGSFLRGIEPVRDQTTR